MENERFVILKRIALSGCIFTGCTKNNNVNSTILNNIPRFSLSVQNEQHEKYDDRFWT